MKKVFSLLSALALGYSLLSAQEELDSIRQVKLEEVTVLATRVSAHSPVAHSNVNEQQIKQDNAAKNIPSLLQTLPSVVAYTEGGTPVGNTSFRIRGTDANRINMTLNGMPLNNPESQEVYWVNLPDISNSLKNIQVQRGVGTATTGTASFGANISMQTVGARPKPYADISSAYGQYNTFLGTVGVGTGIMKNGLSFDARYSYTNSDGYIRNGKVDHKNLFASLSHYTDKQIIKLVYINGIQHTGITWEGIDPAMVKKDRRYNPAGEYVDENGITRYYGNETDNYYSHIVQAQYSRFLKNDLTFNANFGFNNGYGYYENYKVDQKYSKFGLPNQIIDGVEYKKSDIIRRKLMSNNLYSGSANLNYRGNTIDLAMGINFNYFKGDHYGKLLWLKHNNDIANGYEWYRNESDKKDLNGFAKATYSPLSALSFTAELQGRFVSYKMDGIDDDLATLKGDNSYKFFNPNIGATYHINKSNELYFSFGVSNREPLRADLKDAIKGTSAKNIKSERLLDYEFGHRFTTSVLSVNTNLYYMSYKDQLVQTGKLSDTGYKYQENVPDSYRYGVELEAMYNPIYWLGIGGNITWSQNKIKDYTAYFDLYDNPTDWTYLGQVDEFHKKTDISFSPDVVGSFVATFKPVKQKDLIFTLTEKYVGSMYYDNTSNSDSQLPSYWVSNFQASYTIGFNKIRKLEFQLMVNNIFNHKYEANAWADPSRFADGSPSSKGLYPQAGANVMGRVSLNF